MLQAVVEHGGFAQAAGAIHKSQSSINHAVHKLQNQLGLPLLEVVGRKAQLTDAGSLMLRRAEQILQQAAQLEEIAGSLAQGTETEVRIAVDVIYPPEQLVNALHGLAQAFPNTRVELVETVLSGGAEKLQDGEVDLLIAGQVPDGFLGNPIMQAEFIAVCSPGHELLQLGRSVNLQDLAQQRQIVIRDSATRERIDSGWLGAEQRWTVSHIATSVDMVCRGMGFAWLPSTRVNKLLADSRLCELPMDQGSRRWVTLHLVYADSDRAGPATRHLAALLAQNPDDLSI